MLKTAPSRLVCTMATALLTGALGAGCGSSPPVDMNFGTDVGADFRAPVTDAGSDTNLTPESGVTGSGQGGSTGQGGSGATGLGGSSGQTGSDAAAGSNGAAGAG
jgi:hypothetical protein